MEAYIIAGLRTAVGKAPRGVFRFTRADELAANVIKELVASVPNLDKEQIDDVIVGNATPEAEQGLNIGRMISLMGLDTDKVPGVTINRYCASGLETIATAVAKIKSGMADCIVAGGVESMSLIPMGGWRIIPNADVAIAHPDYYWGMGLTAEAVAKEYNISREDQDAFAIESYTRSANAWKAGKFDAEIIPVIIPQKKGDALVVAHDEEYKNVKFDKIPGLNPVFKKDGTVTAANASTINDGASALVLMSKQKMEALGLKPLAKIVSYADAEQAPEWFTTTPSKAIPKALAKIGKTVADVDFFEINEAFSVVSLANNREMKLDANKVNVNGGAVSLGHPLGSSGSRILVTLINVLHQNNAKLGVAGICNGGGGATAVVIEKC